jgi:hypothetical protein
MRIFTNDIVWNILFTVFFFALTIIAWKCLEAHNINLNEIKTYDLFIIVLAAYRLTRLLIHDEVFYYVKDFAKKYRTEQGFIKSASVLLTCPWCVSVWMALIAFFVYMLIPYGKFVIIILALSALSGFFHLLITFIGWGIDEKKNGIKNHNKEN